MGLYFITGNSGTGKSTVCLELRLRGFETLDTDDDALARWQNKQTGYIHPKSSVKSNQRTPDFLNEHAWNVPRQDIVALSSRAQDKDIFICGVANNIEELDDLFNTVFALVVDDDTLSNRLRTRENNDWGKQPHELEQSLAQQRVLSEQYRKLGYLTIDATQPPENVVDQILAAI